MTTATLVDWAMRTGSTIHIGKDGYITVQTVRKEGERKTLTTTSKYAGELEEAVREHNGKVTS